MATTPVKKTKAAPTHPKTLDMVVEAIKSLKDKKGSSVQAIKAYILSHYPTVSASHLTSGLRRAIKSGTESGLLVRPKDSTATGVTGRLRVGKLPEKPQKKPAKKVAPKKKPAKKTPKKTTVKKDKTPKKAKTVTKKPAKKTGDKKKTPKKSTKPKTAPAKKATTKKTPKKPKASKPKKPTTKKVAKK